MLVVLNVHFHFLCIFAQNCQHQADHILHNVQNRWWMGAGKLFSICTQPAASCIYDSLKVTLLKFAKHVIHMFGNLAWECPFGGILCTQYLSGGHEQSARWNNYHCVLIVSPLYRGGRFSAQLVLSGSLLPLEGVIIFWVIIIAALAEVLFPGKNICITNH